MHPYLHRKESVILTAIEIIDELGIHDLTSREIARRQGISEGTLFRHFKNKNEILLGVLAHYSKFDTDIQDSIKIKGLCFKDAITYLLTSYSEYFQNYPAITAVPHNFEILLYDEQMGEKVRDILRTRSYFIKDLVDEGKKNGEIPECINSEYLTDVIVGFFRTTIFKWRVEKYSFSLKDRILATLEMILNGFMTE